MDEGPRIKWISKSAIKRTEQDKKRKTSLQHYEINIEEKASPAKKGYVMFCPHFSVCNHSAIPHKCVLTLLCGLSSCRGLYICFSSSSLVLFHSHFKNSNLSKSVTFGKSRYKDLSSPNCASC